MRDVGERQWIKDDFAASPPSFTGLRIEFAYQCGPYGLKMRGKLGVDL